ncbi:hypothetical protein F1847_08510 [Thermodesulfobacterium sp. TA1]|uniref:peptidylprolyl isomerase n=1 Tax=Thermodesulfobacterium sp. TA1 TaxID=2234087 RepID=UPI00123240EF|nr:SurA N-terminal domain-containing protein [Thermodesulfobacterium sp. TA1]QER42785.1 hypothetical protein F1847_08510 [Thermodesulfobacterium sp. TA1]
MRHNLLKGFLLFFFLVIPIFSYAQAVVKINQIVAVVGEEFLTLYELEDLCAPFYQKFLKPEMSSEEKEKVKEEIRNKVLNDWIEDTLVGLEAKKYGFKVEDEEIEAYLKEEIKSLGGEENFKQRLKEKGLTLEEYKKKIKDILLKMRLVHFMLKEKIVITDEDLKPLYAEEIKRYDKSFRYWLSVFITKDEGLAKSLYEELVKGKTFEDLIKNLSKEKGMFFNESFKEEELDPKVLQKVKELKPEEIAEPLKVGDNFYLIKLIKKGENEPPAFEELKPRLKQKLFEEKAQKFIEKWIKELKEKRYVKIYL